ncbi:unnamed protein product, partial [Dovyalis caffra]
VKDATRVLPTAGSSTPRASSRMPPRSSSQPPVHDGRAGSRDSSRASGCPNAPNEVSSSLPRADSGRSSSP